MPNTLWQSDAGDANRHGDVKAIAKTLLPDIVDDAVFHLLNAIDQGILNVTFKASNGKAINLPEDGLGELGGWYMGSWRELYSRERLVDDFSDLK